MAPARTPLQAGERRTLVVGRGISVQGTITDAERLVVEGTVEASSLNAQELQIAQGGVLKGQVEVEDAEISGLMDGILTVKGSLVLRGSGQVIGEARCRRLQVEDGGQLSGKISMISEAAPAPAPVLRTGGVTSQRWRPAGGGATRRSRDYAAGRAARCSPKAAPRAEQEQAAGNATRFWDGPLARPYLRADAAARDGGRAAGWSCRNAGPCPFVRVMQNHTFAGCRPHRVARHHHPCA